MQEIDPKLTKIIALAKQGIGGEKDAAIAMVRRICLAEGLLFDDVMNATDEREYTLEANPKGPQEVAIVAQVCWRFAVTDAHPGLKQSRAKPVAFYYTTTPAKHIETVNAATVYLRAFRRERRKIMADLIEAFIYKHKLHSQTKDDKEEPAEPKPITAESLRKAQRLMNIADGMDEVTIQKQIGGGTNDKRP